MQDLPVKPQLHVFVCVNERSADDPKPSCAPTITKAEVKEVKQWLITQGLVGRVFCTATHCLGFCSKAGGNACAWPQGRYVQGVRSVDDLKKFILEELHES